MATVRKRLQQLDCWPEIRDRLLAGESPLDLAVFLQAERGVLRDVKVRSITYALLAYRTAEQGVLPTITADGPTRYRQYLESTRLRLNLRRAYQALAELQDYRLRYIHAQELHGEVPIGNFWQEAEVYRRTLADLRGLERALPIGDRSREQLDGDRELVTRPEMVIEQRRVIGEQLRALARKALRELSTEVVDAEVVPNVDATG